MIRVVQAGLLSTVQDEGRWGYQAFGMPVAGAMDMYAHRAANMLVGNAGAAATLEMTMLGGSFICERDCYVAVCGADMQATLNGQPLKNWSSMRLVAGDELVFGFAVSGCRAYLAIYGGFDVPLVMGSRSTYTRGVIGGLEGRALKVGDVLGAGTDYDGAPRAAELAAEFVPTYTEDLRLRVLLGPQDDRFSAAGIETFFGNTYTIGNEADRMGYRLEGMTIEHLEKADIISDALCLGAVQVPGHGLPIVMMADRQTTGGYTKIATVISADLVLLAQAKPGDRVTFVQCDDETACAALAAKEGVYERMAASLCAQATLGAGAKRLQVNVNGQVYRVEIKEVGI